jgi:hypothetical protein
LIVIYFFRLCFQWLIGNSINVISDKLIILHHLCIRNGRIFSGTANAEGQHNLTFSTRTPEPEVVSAEVRQPRREAKYCHSSVTYDTVLFEVVRAKGIDSGGDIGSIVWT